MLHYSRSNYITKKTINNVDYLNDEFFKLKNSDTQN